MAALLGIPATAGVEPDPSIVTPGLFGLVIVLALGVAVFFLYRSMSRQLKRVDFPEPEPTQQPTDSDESKATP